MLDGEGVFDHGAGPWTALLPSAAFAGRLFASDHRWLRLSFLNFETQTTPGQQADRRLCDLFGPNGMELKFYDTLTREKRPFEPLDREQRAHVCVRADGL